MDNLVGRETEIKILNEALKTTQAELIAVYGRRRVGKTHLIRTVYEKNIAFEFSGANQIPLAIQLEDFCLTAQKMFSLNTLIPIKIPENW